MQIDHILIAVADLDAAAREFEDRHGLVATGGGRHPGWGTANRIIALGDAYLELIAVVDECEAAASDFGRWVLAAKPEEPRLFGWAVRPATIDSVADRLGLEVAAGSRETGDGIVIRWRLAGTARAAAEPALPFFIEWAAGTPHPGSNPVTPARVAGIKLTGDGSAIRDWLGDGQLPVEVGEGPSALVAVELLRPDNHVIWLG